jgi:hypothetical protein
LLANLALLAAFTTSGATPPVTDFFHGTAINPNNGEIAGYKDELLTCSSPFGPQPILMA